MNAITTMSSYMIFSLSCALELKMAIAETVQPDKDGYFDPNDPNTWYDSHYAFLTHRTGTNERRTSCRLKATPAAALQSTPSPSKKNDNYDTPSCPRKKAAPAAALQPTPSPSKKNGIYSPPPLPRKKGLGDRLEDARLQAVLIRSQPKKNDSCDPPPLPNTGVSPARLRGARDRADGKRSIDWVNASSMAASMTSDGSTTTSRFNTGIRNTGNYEVFI